MTQGNCEENYNSKPICYDTTELWRKLQVQTCMLRHKGSVKIYKCKSVCYDTRKESKKDNKCKTCMLWHQSKTCMLRHKKTVKKSCKCKPVCYDTRKGWRKDNKCKTCMLWHKERVKKNITSAKPVCYDTRELSRKLQMQTCMLRHKGSANLYAMTQGKSQKKR